MREVIATGKTVEEAIAAGCAQLGVSADSLLVSYEVIDLPQRKLFKSIPAKVKVQLEEEEIAPAAVQEQEAPAAEVVEEAAPAAEPAAASEAAEAPAEESLPEEAAGEEAAEETEVEVDIDAEPKVSAAVEYLKTVFAAMGVEECAFSCTRKGEATIIHVSGNNLSMLIGRRGETMESLSYLAGLVANRMGGDYMMLGLDVAGYRDKREKDLETLARRVGEKVLRTGRSFAMEPMNPYERRILHSTISTMEGLRSESKGEGTDRHVVIYSTAPNARPDRPERERRGGRGGDRRSGGRGDRRSSGRGGFKGGKGGRSSVPGREFANRTHTGDAPTAPVRTQRINDAEDFALFGKIEL